MDIVDYSLAQQETGQKNTDISKDAVYHKLSVRMEKIAAAMYLVTDFWDDHEPMKVQLRSISVRLITLAGTCRYAGHQSVHDSCSTISMLAEEATTLISVAGLVGIMTDMNASVLKAELVKVQEIAATSSPDGSRTTGTSRHRGVVLPDNFFSADTEPVFGVSAAATMLSKGHTTYKGHVNDMSFINKKEGFSKKDLTDTEKTSSKKFDVVQKINRRNSILELIKDKKEVMIKDITMVISDCSEKTVQRELGVLVDQGILKRVGKKRWSKYSII